jgi:hypothetical protein
VTASVKQPIRILVFSSAVLVALLFAEQQAHADDATQADAPAPDPGGAAPPAVDPPALPPVVDPTPPVADPSTPTAPIVVPPIVGGGTIDPPALPGPPPSTLPHPSTTPDPGFAQMPVGSGETTNQSADVTTGGTAVANTGGNTALAGATGASGSETAPPGVIALPFSGPSGSVTTGNAGGRGSVDENGIQQVVNATTSENGKVTVVQVAIIVNVGIGLAGSGGNFAAEAAIVTPTASVAMVIGQNETAGAGGSGPTPAQIDTGNANATGNTGTTSVKQTIQLTGGDVANQLASVLNIGVGVANSGLNFALASVSTNNGGGPQSVTFVTMGGSNITSGPAHALGNRSTSTIFQIVTVSASGNGSLLVVQRAIIVNFGLALANSGLNAAGSGALTGALPNTANAQELLLMLLEHGSSSATPVMLGVIGGGSGDIGTGRAGAIGNDTETGISQHVDGSVTGDDTARAIQDAWVGNFGVGVANSGGNGAGGLSGLDASSVGGARDALWAFLSGLTGLGEPVQGLDASFQLGSNLLQLHGDVSGTETLLGVAEPGAEVSPDDAAVVIRQITAVLNIGIALGDSGHNTALAVSNRTTTGGDGSTVAGAEITTGDAQAVGNHFVATVCQAIGATVSCNPPPEKPHETPGPPGSEEPPPGVPVRPDTVENPHPVERIPPPFTPPVFGPAPRPATLPFTGSPIGAELAAGSGLLIAGMLMARRRRTGAIR